MDIEQIHTWWDIFHEEGRPTEIRVLGNGKTFSGYYMDVEKLISDVNTHDWTAGEQIYFTINAISQECYSREQHECLKLIKGKTPTTSDRDITHRRWVLIDLDPKRPAGISSSADELKYAHEMACKVYLYLQHNGFNEPVVAMSGNGYHLLYKCDMKATDEATLMVKRFLQAVAMIFSDDKVDVDTSVFNNARISKLYGTTAKKGANTKERPHRLSKIIKVPAIITETPEEYFKKIADLYPDEAPKPTRENNWGRDKFDVREFFSRHNIGYKEERVAGGTKFVLDHCAFNYEHKGKDAAVFQRDNGMLSYVCLHNSCSHYRWRDFRMAYEPDAYDKKDYKEYQARREYYEPRRPQPQQQPQAQVESKGDKWLTMSSIKDLDLTGMTIIPTGYAQLDWKILGLIAGDVSVISGTSGSGKTSWIDCICLNAVNNGFKTAIWSGELQDFRFKGWMSQIAAGPNYVDKKAGTECFWYARPEVVPYISQWLEGKMFLYNNNYGNRWSQLFGDIKEIVEKEHIDLVVLDNLMALNLDIADFDKYSRQTVFINDLKEYAKLKNIHIILVCHPRKEMGFLRKESISGTADLTNLCDNLFIIHRTGNDFEKRAEEFFGKRQYEAIMANKYDSVVEVCKNRSVGIVDYICGMYYEKNTRRLKDKSDECKSYGWEKLIPEDSPLMNPIPEEDQLPF